MTRTFKDLREMLAYIRHQDVEVRHKAVKAEDVMPKKSKKKGKKKEDE